MHTPSQDSPMAMVEGTHGAEDEMTKTPATDAHPPPGRINMGPPQKEPQDSPAIEGWGMLPWGGLPGYMTNQQSRTSAHTNPRRGEWPQTGSDEPQRVESFQSVTSDFIVFEEVNGKWVLQPKGLQMETRGLAPGPLATTQGEGTPPSDQICNITPEKILWIHTILNPLGLDLRGEGELARAMGEWGDGLSAGTQVFTPPSRLTIKCSRRERCSRPQDRAGWALLHWYEQGLSQVPVIPACTWCGQPATSACEACTTVVVNIARPLSKCLECAADELLRGCRRCSGTLATRNYPTERGAQGEDLAPEAPASNDTGCERMCSRGPCIEQCIRDSRHHMTECSCEGHNFEIDAELFAEHIRDCIITAGVDTTGISNYDIGTKATRILKSLVDGKPTQGQMDT